MTGELDAAGDVVTGVLVARAMDPKGGERRDGDPAHVTHCLNCRAELTGAYCARCGQPAAVRRTMAAIWHDILHGVLHFEGKIWQTLPELARRPGQLTRRYIRGERARFVSPLALFLFSAFLMYAVYSLTGDSGGSRPVSVRDSVEELREETEKADRRIANVEASLREPGLTANRRAKLQQRLVDARADRQDLAAASTIVESISRETPDRQSRTASLLGQYKNDPDLVAYRLKANAYKLSWILILISTPFVWLLFLGKRDYGLYDHAVFVTYSIAFMSMLFSVWMIASAVGFFTGIITLALMLYALWHMYRQMKEAYLLSRAGALVRLPFLYSFAAVSGGMFYALLSAVS